MKSPGSAQKPLLLLDVDGVISLFGFPHDNRPTGTFLTVDGIPHYLSGTVGGHLRTLAGAFELVWCTGWEERANDYLPHALGMPGPLPFVTLQPKTGAYTHWKLGAIDAYAGRARPVAWVDDDHTDECRTWANTRPAPTLLITTQPAQGLTEAATKTLLRWTQELRTED